MRQQRFEGNPDINRLEDFAVQLRRDSLRMIHHAGAGHIGGTLGLADFMAVLYGYAMAYDSENPADPDRDRLVLSNGHTCAVWYAALARKGFLPLEELGTFRRLGSRLQGHPARTHLPELVETSTGPLGQGFSVANGIAMSRKFQGSSARVYCILGDGELQEGQVWEAAMTAAHYKLGNLTVFINANGLQIDGRVEDVMNIAPIDGKFESFGWNTISIDGCDIPGIIRVLEEINGSGDKPTVLIAETEMGKGVQFMEGKAEWHGTWPDEAQTEAALLAVGTSSAFKDFPIAKELIHAG